MPMTGSAMTVTVVIRVVVMACFRAGNTTVEIVAVIMRVPVERK